MGVVKIDIDTDAVVKFTGKLEKMHRSALPNVIRTTLNSAAFDVKKKTMPDEAKRTFVNRNKTFFSANSRVQMAKGFDIKTMNSKVGFINGEKNQAVRDLESQERGGSIGGRSFVPLDSARVSGNNARNLRRKNRISNIQNIATIRRKKDFHKIVNAVGVNGEVLYKNTLFRIDRITGSKIKLTPLFSFKRGRSVKIDSTYFMQKSSTKSAQKMDQFYIKEAKKRLVK